MPIDHLRVDGLSVNYADRRVLTDVSLTAPPGARIALVGENGSGKTTVLRCCAGQHTPDHGSIERPHRVGLLDQELAVPADGTFGDVLHTAVAPIRNLVEDIERLGTQMSQHPQDQQLADLFAATLHEAQQRQAWSIEARVQATLAGLSIAEVPARTLVSELSGGQRKRLALAALLLARPTLLLLDEPTNHLDEAGLTYLANELRTWSGPLLFSSHDRCFLDEVATGVIDLDPAPTPVGTSRQGVAYSGTYSDYLAARTDSYRRWQHQYRTEQEELKQLRHEVNVAARDVFHRETAKSEARIAVKFYGDRAATTIGRRVRSARTRLERLTAEQVVKPHEPLHFTGFNPRTSTSAATGQALVSLANVALTNRLAAMDLSLSDHDRLLITGANGAGKSTLLAVLAGTLTPTHGSRTQRGNTRIGLLSQDVTLPGEPDETPAAVFARQHGKPPPGLLAPRDLNRPLRELSLGTARRVALGLILANPPHLLLLDEPTNHLALRLVEELEAALPDYPGAIVIASHDRRLRERWTGRILHLSAPGTTK